MVKQEQIDKIISFFNIISVKEISNMIGISVPTIYKIFKENNLIFKNRKYEIDETYFENIHNEEKSYWLGFLYADGYVRLKYNRSGQLRLKLKKEDISHIEKFKNDIKSTQIIDSYISSVKVNNKIYKSEVSEINIYSTKIVKDLYDKGCFNNKTHTIIFPSWLNNDLIPHFIRGFFDGDGSISIGKFNITLNFVSGSYLFLESIKKEFEKLDIFDCKISKNKSNCWYMTWQKIDDIIKIYNYMYKKSTIQLDRKKEKFEFIFSNYDIIRDQINLNNRKKYKGLKNKNKC